MMITLAAIGILAGTLVIATWLSPIALRRLAAFLLARAESVQRSREVFPVSRAHWLREFGIDER